MHNDIKIGFIGTGTMAKAIINGLLASDFVQKQNIMGSEISEELAKKASKELGIEVVTNNASLAKACDYIILCAKPYAIEEILSNIKEKITGQKTVVSIAAGVSIEKMQNALSKKVPLIRVMPNTPALVNEGMTAICRGEFATDEQTNFVKDLFSKTGICVEVPEKIINAVTGISGSGPAFIYLIIEALADGGVKNGIPKPLALELAAQTTLGAAKMVLESGKHPSVLKDEVTTPGGCTAAGLAVLEEEGVRSSLIKTVQKTAEKSAELG